MTSSVVIEEKIKFNKIYPKEVDIDVDNIIKFSHHSTTTTPEVYVDKENESLLIINFRSERTCKERLPKYLILTLTRKILIFSSSSLYNNVVVIEKEN